MDINRVNYFLNSTIKALNLILPITMPFLEIVFFIKIAQNQAFISNLLVDRQASGLLRILFSKLIFQYSFSNKKKGEFYFFIPPNVMLKSCFRLRIRTQQQSNVDTEYAHSDFIYIIFLFLSFFK